MISKNLPFHIVEEILSPADRSSLARNERVSKEIKNTLTKAGLASPWRAACIKDFGEESTHNLVSVCMKSNYKIIYAQLRHNQISSIVIKAKEAYLKDKDFVRDLNNSVRDRLFMLDALEKSAPSKRTGVEEIDNKFYALKDELVLNQDDPVIVRMISEKQTVRP